MLRLSISNLIVERGGRTIVRGVDLQVTSGEVLGVLGPSGAGKSTLFRAITGEWLPNGGTVCLDENDVTNWPLWRRARAGIGYIPQSPSIFWDLTVAENLSVFDRLVHGKTGDVLVRADQVDLRHRLHVRAGELSAGERRRLEFARAITRPPRALICDEPFAGVDPAGAQRLGELLREYSRQGVAVVLADHHVSEALRICTRALLLLDGSVAVTAEPDAFREHPLVQGRYLGSWSRTVPPPKASGFSSSPPQP